MDMELLFPYILLVLFPVYPAHSNKGGPGLICTNDLVNNVTCTWVGSRNDSGEDCWISGVKKDWNYRSKDWTFITQRCKLKQHIKSPPSCSFAFSNAEFSGSEKMPSIRLECNGTLLENLVEYFPAHHIKIRPPHAPNVTVTTNETWISWRHGKPVSYMLKSELSFEVQITSSNHSWEEAKNLKTEEQELTLPSYKLKGYQRARVRAKPRSRNGSHWSNWSPVTSWMGPTDRVDMTDNQGWWLELELEQGPLMAMGLTLAVCPVVVVVVLLLLYKNCKTRRLIKAKPVPNPSNYFHSLYSIHGGNLKKWLNPLPVSESFATPQSCDQISSVEVCEDWKQVHFLSPSSSPTIALLDFHGHLSSGSKNKAVAYNSSSSSDYSNMGYFMSSSSGGSARSDPTYFTYQDDFRGLPSSHSHHHALCAPLTSCPSYESLKMVLESPDSGFGITMEHEMEVNQYTDTEGENVLNDLISTALILPLHLPSHMCPSSPPPAPPHLPTITHTLSDSQQAMVHEAAASCSSAPRLASGAMCRSSSMPVEPSKPGYLTLKELHTTFSNKSI